MAANTISISPDVLKWARERARYSEATLARKIGTSEKRYRAFEEGSAAPTMRQLYKLSKSLNRSSGFFFMTDPPAEEDVLLELRRLPGSQPGRESPELAYRVSLIHDYREIAKRLFEALDREIPALEITGSVSEHPNALASRLRERLGVKIETQISWAGDEYLALKTWREALGEAGVLVFQIPYVDLDEMRGISLPYDELPVIGINSKDTVKARIFTIFHELAHIAIGDPVLDTAETDLWETNQETEHFCNQVAASILVPRDDLLEASAAMGKTKDSEWKSEEIKYLANRYVVSWEVLARRLSELDLISRKSFNEFIAYLRGLPLPKKAPGGDPYKNSVARVGSLLTELALVGYYQNVLTESDLSSLFNLQVSNLGGIEELAFGNRYMFGD